MHRLSERIICQKLIELGFLHGNIEEILEAYVPNLFMPHGLGHLLGLDTHDVGGYVLGTSRVQQPGLKSLRLGRPLEAGMLITVEPGIYFNKHSLEKVLDDPKYSKFLNKDKIREYYNFGGVRIEDDIVITETGYENLTHWCPKTIQEIEEIMKKD